jgi:hypothetical protein
MTEGYREVGKIETTEKTLDLKFFKLTKSTQTHFVKRGIPVLSKAEQWEGMLEKERKKAQSGQTSTPESRRLKA